MRWIFLFLLAVNIAYVGWELSQPVLPQALSMQDAAAVPQIVLLSELAGSEAAVGNPPEPAGVETPAPDAPVLAEAAPTPEPAALPEPVSAAQPTSVCYTLGPFREINDLRKLIRDIREYVSEASFRSREEREQSMYWVYLPAQKDRETATALGAELKRKNIRDYYVVNSGEQINAISLGHFREKSGALSVLEKVRQAGFAPVIEPVFKSYTLYWLDYRVQSDRTIPSTVLDLSTLPNASRFDRSCE